MHSILGSRRNREFRSPCRSKEYVYLRRVCHEIFLPLFIFHDSHPSGPLKNKLKYFHILFNFAERLEFLINSMVCIPPRSQSPQCASHRGVNLRSVHQTAESIVPNFSGVQNTISQTTLRYASLHRDNLRSVHHSTETISQQLCSHHVRVINDNAGTVSA